MLSTEAKSAGNILATSVSWCRIVRIYSTISTIYSHISIKLQADSNIFVSPEASRGNCLPYVLAPPSLPASQEDKYRDKIK